MRRHVGITGAAALAAVVATGLAQADVAMRVGQVFRDAGETLSMSGKGQSKLAWVDGAWWGVFSSASGADLFRLQGTTWVQESSTGSHLTDDPDARADVLTDGTDLLVLLNETVGGVTELRLYDFAYVRPGFRLRGGFPAVVVERSATDPLEDDMHTLALDSHRRLWVAYRAGPTCGIKGSRGTGPSGWLTYFPAVTFGDLGNGVAENLSNCTIVATGSGTDAKVGVLWADQSAPPNNAYLFRYRLDSATAFTSDDWSAQETAYTNGSELVANDQLMAVGFEGKVYAAVKTDTTPSADNVGMDRFDLLVRDTLGDWGKTTIDTIQSNGDPATRAQLAIDEEHRQIYAFWHRVGIVGKISSVDSPSFLDQPLYSFLAPVSQTSWDSQTTHQLLSSRTGLLVVADDNDTGFRSWSYVGLGVPSSQVTSGPVLSTISLAPAISAVGTGTQVQLAASALDQSGNPFPITPSWTADGGAVASTGLYTSGATTGVFGVAATQSETAHGTVFVGAQPLVTSLVVSPDPWVIFVGQTVSLSVSGLTASGQSVAVVASVTWSLASGVGSVDSSGVYQAPSGQGLANVSAAALGLEGFASIVVQAPSSTTTSSGGGGGGGETGGGGGGATSPPPQLARIVVTPGTASVAAGASQGFSAEGFDASGDAVALAPSWSASGGTIGSSGFFVAGSSAGTFTVTASQSGILGSATITVTAALTAKDPPAATSGGGGDGGGGGGGGGGCELATGQGSCAGALGPLVLLGLAVIARRSRVACRLQSVARRSVSPSRTKRNSAPLGIVTSARVSRVERMSALSAPPWVTTRAGLPGRESLRVARTRALRTRARNSSKSSPSGTGVTSGSRRHADHSSGYCSSHSGRVSPSKTPRPRSRRSRSTRLTFSSRAVATISAVSRARHRSLAPIAAIPLLRADSARPRA